jgi:hypothetical protein
MAIKYPRTFHWPESLTVHSDDSYHTDPSFFLNKDVVITEKLDGGNTCLHHGEVYARSVSAPSNAGWMAMVKKHHAWKTNVLEFYFNGHAPEDTYFYGEDIYGEHSIIYDAVRAEETYHLFNVRYKDQFLSWDDVKLYAELLGMKHVPNIFAGQFSTIAQITQFFNDELKKPSALGTEREGFVMRIAGEFTANKFATYVCKFVRPNHVQTDQHWTKNWRPCKIIT